MVLKRRRILLIGRNFPLMAHSARLGAVSFLVTPRPFLFVDLPSWRFSLILAKESENDSRLPPRGCEPEQNLFMEKGGSLL